MEEEIMAEPDVPVWQASSSCSDGACVEIASFDGDVLVRDSVTQNAPATPRSFTQEPETFKP
jgi:hypothetical protein